MFFHRCVALVLLAASAAGLSLQAQESRELPLSRAADLRSLSIEEAELGRRVRVRGVVVFSEPSAVFVRDESATTFFRPRPEHVVNPGDEVEVIGPTRMGLYLPGIALADSVKILGTKPLPEPLLVTFDDIATARFHYQHVAVEGVVRSVHLLSDSRGMIRIAADSRVLEIRVDAPFPSDLALVDCRVRVSGLAAGFINDRRQVVQAYVRVQSWADVTVVEPATPLAAVPTLSADELLAYRPTGRLDRRIKIEGQLIAAFPDGELYLRQGNVGFAVSLTTPEAVEVGDHLQFLGFPVMTTFAAAVDDATIAARTVGQLPKAIDVGTVDELKRVHHAELVTVTATVADAFTTPDGVSLILTGKTQAIRALGAASLQTPTPGSIVRVTGICLVKGEPGTTFSTHAGSISLRVRSSSDIHVIKDPPWWTVRKMGTALVGVLGVTALAGLWIASLRRQVLRQTEALRHRIESEAAMQERHRIAREFHDSLEQELAGVSLRLDALTTRITDEKGKDLATASRNLVARIQAETRSLISDLRDPIEMAGDLPAALQQVAARQTSDHGIQANVTSRQEIPRLPAAVVHDLRMITGEAITNARKHGAAQRAEVTVGVHENELSLRIADDGTGFDPERVTAAGGGRFGCAGIRERARKLGGSVSWERSAQGGALVLLLMPLPSRITPRDTGRAARPQNAKSH